MLANVIIWHKSVCHPVFMLHKAATMQVFAFLKWLTWSKSYFISHKFNYAVAAFGIMWALKMKINYRRLCTFLMYLLLLHQWQGHDPKRDVLSILAFIADTVIALYLTYYSHWRLNICWPGKTGKQIMHLIYIVKRQRESAVISYVSLALHCSGKNWMCPYCWAITQQDTNHWWRRERPTERSAPSRLSEL